MGIARWGLILFFLCILACSSAQDLKNKEDATNPQNEQSASGASENSTDKALLEWEMRVSHRFEENNQNTAQMVQGWVAQQILLVQRKEDDLKQLQFIQKKVENFMQRILYQIELQRNLVRDFDEWMEKKARDREQSRKDKDVDFMNSKPYQFLQTEKEEYDSNMNELMLVYGYAAKWANQEEDALRKELAKGIICKIKSFLDSKQKIFPYAVHNLGLLMDEVNEPLRESKLNQFLIVGNDFLIESKTQLKQLQRAALSKNLKSLPVELKKKLEVKVSSFKKSLNREI